MHVFSFALCLCIYSCLQCLCTYFLCIVFVYKSFYCIASPYHQFTFCLNITIGEHDLLKILNALEKISEVDLLGIRLGLQLSTVERISKECQSVEQKKVSIIKTWLRRNDIVPYLQSHCPTWTQLAEAVAKENVVVAETIRRKYVKDGPRTILSAHINGFYQLISMVLQSTVYFYFFLFAFL